MLQLVEMEGKMTENGCIEIPAVVLEQAGICTGDTAVSYTHLTLPTICSV